MDCFPDSFGCSDVRLREAFTVVAADHRCLNVHLISDWIANGGP